MPTFEVRESFFAAYDRLSVQDRQRFREVRKRFVQCLKDWENAGFLGGVPTFPNGLGVKHKVGDPGVLELRWGPDERATWRYDISPRPGKCHVIWLDIGTHAIYSRRG